MRGRSSGGRSGPSPRLGPRSTSWGSGPPPDASNGLRTPVLLGEVGARFAQLPDGARSASQLKQFHRQALEHLEAVLVATDSAAANDLLDVGDALLQSGRAVADRLLSSSRRSAGAPVGEVATSRALDSIARTIAYAQDIAQLVLDRPVLWEAAARRAPEGSPPPQSRSLSAV